MDVTARVEVSMGHRLVAHRGLCANLHGHNYVFEVTVSGNPDAAGLVMDFADLKQLLRNFLKSFDHAMVLQDGDPAIPAIKGMASKLITLTVPPSAEYFGALVFNFLVDHNVPPKAVRVQETSSGWATVEGVDRAARVTGRSA